MKEIKKVTPASEADHLTNKYLKISPNGIVATGSIPLEHLGHCIEVTISNGYVPSQFVSGKDGEIVMIAYKQPDQSPILRIGQ